RGGGRVAWRSPVPHARQDAGGNNERPGDAKAPDHVPLKRLEPLIDPVEPPFEVAEGATQRVEGMLGDWGTHGIIDDTCLPDGSARGASASARSRQASQRPQGAAPVTS